MHQAEGTGWSAGPPHVRLPVGMPSQARRRGLEAHGLCQEMGPGVAPATVG